jgi:hypothetical protein
MKFAFVDDLGIKVSLKILQQDTQPYSCLLYQHNGTFTGSSTFMGNANDATDQLNSFFDLAVQKNTDLVMTPEYSCPWSEIERIIASPASWPKAEKLWAIGCESVTKESLLAFEQKYQNASIHIYFNRNVLLSTKTFLDPVVFLFKELTGNVERLIVIIQFKTYHMGVWTTSDERDNIIEGNDIYVFRNSLNSMQLITLICSEAMNFETELNVQNLALLDWYNKPTLVLHPQCNPDPFHLRFIDFRRFLWDSDKKELISLNWSSASKFGKNGLMRNNSSRSGFAVKSPEVNLSHERVKQNHAFGMYYFSVGQDKHFFILNSTVAVFIIQNMSVYPLGGFPEQRRRDGPKILEAFHFNDTFSALLPFTIPIPDRHIEFLSQEGCGCAFLNIDGNCVLEKEMLVSLSSGKVSKGKDWYNLGTLFAVQTDENNEKNARITFVEDNLASSIIQRNEYLTAIRILNSQVLNRPALFPESMQHLTTETLSIGYNNMSRKNQYQFNVVTASGSDKSACICYLPQADQAIIETTFRNMQGMFDYSNAARGTVVVFYQKGNDIVSFSDPTIGKIANTNPYGPESILK